jgi:pre-mRNA cleavage complex 2 protein Pcf11
MKLPAFYLLDAISKNVYDPYASKFSTFVVPLFMESYGMVDPPTRSKMEEMLVTWRNGSPNGRELFGVAAQVALERRLWGNDTATSVEVVSLPLMSHSLSRADVSYQPTRRNQAPPPITKSQVLAELEVTLAQKDRACQVNPYDTNAQNQVAVLHQVC